MSNEAIELSSLDSFYEDDLIVDVLDIIKRGKEAAVYRCQAHPSTGVELLAAKVYRARETRSFKNDAMYQQGRVILDRRLRRAVRKKSRTGREVQSGSWIEHEFQALNLLHANGADVPRPLKRSGPAILMEYVGDHESSAPMLRSVRLTNEEARVLFRRVMQNVKLFLTCNLVHGDLSPYNILYWKGTVKIIDFPQSIDPRRNRSAFPLLSRDIDNLCRYFVRYGVQVNASRIAGALWTGFLRAEL